MRRLTLAAVCAASVFFSAPTLSFADDPSETSDHSGKKVDGKTNGMTEQAAEKAARQQKEPPKVQSETSDAAPAKAGAAEGDGKKSP